MRDLRGLQVRLGATDYLDLLEAHSDWRRRAPSISIALMSAKERPVVELLRQMKAQAKPPKGRTSKPSSQHKNGSGVGFGGSTYTKISKKDAENLVPTAYRRCHACAACLCPARWRL
jgi:hypothetical protein